MYKEYKVTGFLIVSLFLFTACSSPMDYKDNTNNLNFTLPEKNKIRQPAVAGSFYPGKAKDLQAKIEYYLDKAKNVTINGSIKAVLAPHAGYDYSGQVAAASFKQLQGQKYGTIVLLCNAHAEYFSGIAIDDVDYWQTPLGSVALDHNLAEKLVKENKNINYNNRAHLSDHSLEVQIPWLQTVLDKDFKIVPILFGSTNKEMYKELAESLLKNMGANDLVVVSTDLSHYPPYEQAQKIDNQTLELIKAGNIQDLETHINKVLASGIEGEETLCCGIDGVKTLMLMSKEKNWQKSDILSYANSGDTAIGDKKRVVGYGAMLWSSTNRDNIMTEEKQKLNIDQQTKLLAIARKSVEAKVRGEKIPKFEIEDERLERHEGAFVTLHKKGKLRGCIGQIVPSEQSLWQVISEMAVAACSEDHRFLPVRPAELSEIDYEISVLSVPERISNWQDMELGKHGVIVRKGARTGVFLPQVATETGWSKEEFLSQLCTQKAGLPADCYKNNDVELLVFSAQVFSEKDKDKNI